MLSRIRISGPDLLRCNCSIFSQRTYIHRVQSSVWRLPNYWPLPPLHPASVSHPRTKGGGVHTRRAVRGWGGGQYIGRRQTLDWPGLLQSTEFLVYYCRLSVQLSESRAAFVIPIRVTGSYLKARTSHLKRVNKRIFRISKCYHGSISMQKAEPLYLFFLHKKGSQIS